MRHYKENTNYVFMYGAPGVGKSSLLASMCFYLQQSDYIRLRKNITSREEFNLLRQEWLERYAEMQYPPVSRRGDIFEIDIGIQKVGSDSVLPLTFLEVSGEDLRLLENRFYDEKGEAMVVSFVDYIKRSKMVLLVTSPETMRKDEYSFDEFFELMIKNDVSKPVGIVVTKIDHFVNKEELFEDYFKRNMPSTYKWIDSGDVEGTRVFKYSSGCPKVGVPYQIESYPDFQYAKKLMSWVYRLF